MTDVQCDRRGRRLHSQQHHRSATSSLAFFDGVLTIAIAAVEAAMLSPFADAAVQGSLLRHTPDDQRGHGWHEGGGCRPAASSRDGAQAVTIPLAMRIDVGEDIRARQILKHGAYPWSSPLWRSPSPSAIRRLMVRPSGIQLNL